MHWITKLSKNSFLANHKRIFGVSRRENATTTAAQSSPREGDSRIDRRNKLGVKSIGKPHDVDGDSIVISGISGRFPMTDSMEEFKYNLMNKVDMVTPIHRWPTHHGRMPTKMGTMKNLDKFDAEFFGVIPSHAETMDPSQRRLHEVAFEAFVDAGINPTTVRGSSTGIYVGSVGKEASDHRLAKGDTGELVGYKVLGVQSFLQPNRVSHALSLKGPSMTIFTGCSASMVALETAMLAIRAGACEQAIVAGTAVHVNPFDLSQNGVSSGHNEDADGFVRSEAIIAVLLQKKRDAKRHYATVRGIKTKGDGCSNEGVTFPVGLSREELLRATYAECGIDPARVTYFEADGAGTVPGDPQDLHAITQVMCNGIKREQPLLIGWVGSNMGHAESAAGLCSLAKVLIAIEQGVIPPNLHSQNPDFVDGSIKIISEPTPWAGGLVGISSFGSGGSTAHMILEPGLRTNKRNSVTKLLVKDKKIPILIPLSGRSHDKVKEGLEEANKFGNNVEVVGLLHQVFQTNIPGHDYRGHAMILPGRETPIILVDKLNSHEKRPLWFIFSGVGSQWNEMGKELMKIDAYAESIRRSQIVLKNTGLNLIHLLKPKNPSLFENIRDALVAITAVQIAVLDTLTSMGIKPDGFAGHSTGEILCAYADGCLSAEEALLVGEAHGRAFRETIVAPGGMASVGLSWENAKARCPPGIHLAYHNAAENVTVSGPLEDVKKFTQQLQSEGIFAQQVNSCNCAPHSSFIQPAVEAKLVDYMNEIFQDERPRSSRWISSSIPESEWNTPMAQTSSPAYHVNNMRNPVLFHEAVQKVPKNAIVVEIAPRGLPQPILRESLGGECSLISLMDQSAGLKLQFFLSSLGKMYNAGVDMSVGNLYPAVSFPVSSSTPMLSSLVKWNHERSWTVPNVPSPIDCQTPAPVQTVSGDHLSFLKSDDVKESVNILQ